MRSVLAVREQRGVWQHNRHAEEHKHPRLLHGAPLHSQEHKDEKGE